MQKHFVDTNIFIRFLLKDNPEQYKKAEELLIKGGEKTLKLYTSTLVIFEISWVLKSVYEFEKMEIIMAIGEIFRMSFIEITERPELEAAIGYFVNSSLSLEDCYNTVYSVMHGIPTIETFDEKLQKFFKEITTSTSLL